MFWDKVGFASASLEQQEWWVASPEGQTFQFLPALVKEEAERSGPEAFFLYKDQ